MALRYTVSKPQDYREMPWKNGGGSTTEIAVYPPPRANSDTHIADSFLWRISCAQVTQAGPFSAFPGYTRYLALLDGDGLRLHFAGEGAPDAPVTLSPAERFQPVRFPGDCETRCDLLGGPVRDLNVMLRSTGRVTASAEPRAVRVPTVRSVASYLQGDTAIIIGLKGSVQIDIGEEKPVVLNKLETLRIELTDQRKPFMIMMDAVWPDTTVYIVDIKIG